MFETLVDRQDHQLAGAAQMALHQDAGQFAFTAGLVPSYLSRMAFTVGVMCVS